MNPNIFDAEPAGLEVKVTALLLGELTAEEAAAMRWAISQDADLMKLHERQKIAIELMGEVIGSPVGQTGTQPAPARLSEERRQKLLAHFKTVSPREFQRVRRRFVRWLVPLSAAAAIVGFVGGALLWPTLAGRRQGRSAFGRDFVGSSPTDVAQLKDMRSTGPDLKLARPESAQRKDAQKPTITGNIWDEGRLPRRVQVAPQKSEQSEGTKLDANDSPTVSYSLRNGWVQAPPPVIAMPSSTPSSSAEHEAVEVLRNRVDKLDVAKPVVPPTTHGASPLVPSMPPTTGFAVNDDGGYAASEDGSPATVIVRRGTEANKFQRRDYDSDLNRSSSPTPSIALPSVSKDTEVAQNTDERRHDGGEQLQRMPGQSYDVVGYDNPNQFVPQFQATAGAFEPATLPSATPSPKLPTYGGTTGGRATATPPVPSSGSSLGPNSDFAIRQGYVALGNDQLYSEAGNVQSPSGAKVANGIGISDRSKADLGDGDPNSSKMRFNLANHFEQSPKPAEQWAAGSGWAPDAAGAPPANSETLRGFYDDTSRETAARSDRSADNKPITLGAAVTWSGSLTGNNSFSGPVTVNAGTLAAGTKRELADKNGDGNIGGGLPAVTGGYASGGNGGYGGGGYGGGGYGGGGGGGRGGRGVGGLGGGGGGSAGNGTMGGGGMMGGAMGGAMGGNAVAGTVFGGAPAEANKSQNGPSAMQTVDDFFVPPPGSASMAGTGVLWTNVASVQNEVATQSGGSKSDGFNLDVAGVQNHAAPGSVVLPNQIPAGPMGGFGALFGGATTRSRSSSGTSAAPAGQVGDATISANAATHSIVAIADSQTRDNINQVISDMERSKSLSEKTQETQKEVDRLGGESAAAAPPSPVQQGRSLFEAGKLDEAERKFNEAVAADPQDQVSYYYQNLISERRYNEALDDGRTGASHKRVTEIEKRWDTPVNKDGLPMPNPYAGTNVIFTGKTRQDIVKKLNQIHLDSVQSQGLPLSEVVKNLSDEAKRRDPEKRGINFIIESNIEGPANKTKDPTTGQMVPAETYDVGSIPINVGPPIHDLTLDQALDVLTRAAGKPIKYSIEDYAVVFSLKQPEPPPAPRQPAPTAPIPQPEVLTSDNTFSTFSLNVSDVSFKLAAASLEKGQMPDPASVRTEEFINAFDYRDPEAAPGAPIAFNYERAHYPYAHNRDLLRFSIKTAAEGRQAGKPLNLVLLLDNSGSMERADRVQIIHEALRVLASQLRPQDKLSVVLFSRTARLWVDGISGDQAARVAEEVSGVTPEGGTNLEEAMNLAYATAVRHYLAEGMNRVVLLTDGAANLGNVSPQSLKAKVDANRKQGIALDCFGIGWEGYNDDLLEVLTRNGNGRYGFINSPEEAANEFAGQLAGALHVAASDVKVQVEFNPKRVNAYRQLGYAKHQLTKEQFRDNTVTAAEIAAQEAGNALYVVEVNAGGEGPVATVRVRYREPGTSDYHEHEWEVPYNGNAPSLEQASVAMRLAGTASAFSEWLVASPYAAEVTPDSLLKLLRGVPEACGADARPKKLETMIREAGSVAGK